MPAGLDLYSLSLSWLDLSQTDLQAIARHTNLEHLRLHSCSMAALPPSFTALTALCELDLSNCRNLHTGLGCLASYAQLESLKLASCYFIRELPHEISRCTALQWIDLTNCLELEDGLQHLARLPKLSALEMSTQSDVSLPHAFSGLSSLQFLQLGGQQAETPASLAPVAQLPQLGKLNVCLRSVPGATAPRLCSTHQPGAVPCGQRCRVGGASARPAGPPPAGAE